MRSRGMDGPHGAHRPPTGPVLRQRRGSDFASRAPDSRDQRHSESIISHQRPSDYIRCHQHPVIRVHHRPSETHHQRPRFPDSHHSDQRDIFLSRLRADCEQIARGFLFTCRRIGYMSGPHQPGTCLHAFGHSGLHVTCRRIGCMSGSHQPGTCVGHVARDCTSPEYSSRGTRT